MAQGATTQEMNQQYEASQSENHRLSEELKQIRGQLATTQNNPALNDSAQTSPQASYAGRVYTADKPAEQRTHT